MLSRIDNLSFCDETPRESSKCGGDSIFHGFTTITLVKSYLITSLLWWYDEPGDDSDRRNHHGRLHQGLPPAGARHHPLDVLLYEACF